MRLLPGRLFDHPLRLFPVRALCALGLALAAIPSPALFAQDASVHVQPADLHGSRPLEKLTESAVVRDYVESWKSLGQALDQNDASVLGQDFIGTALTKLSDTVAQQQKLGIHTSYQVQSHNLQIVFYSPDGLSIQIVDEVDYTEQVMKGSSTLGSQPMHARYVAVLTPSQTRWQVRILQAQ